MNKFKSLLLVFIFMVINMTYADLLPTTMSCFWDSNWANDYDGPFSSSKNDRFFSGMHSIHSNHHEDRLYKFRRCKPTSFSTVTSILTTQPTGYDTFWQRSCGAISDGNYAITGISSWHDNHREDRQFKIYCGSLAGTDYTLANCEWTQSYTSYDQLIHYVCPESKVLRGLKSYHSNHNEDRKFIFECCQIMEPVRYSFEDITGEWELVGGNINGEHEYTLTTGTESGITNSITDEYSQALSVTVGLGFDYAAVSGNVEVTGEIAQLMSSTMEKSFTHYAEKSVTKSCDRDFYYQWVVSGTEKRSDGVYDIFDVYSEVFICTDVPQPKCPPFMAIDCDYQICTDKITRCDDNN
eukprot:71426_1